MKQPEITKHLILEEASILFNTKGYKATSISDITIAIGLTKGSIYRHFASKEQLELECLKHMFKKVEMRLTSAIVSESTAYAKLNALFLFFENYIQKPIVAGGCPLLNASVEADDSYPLLRGEAVKMMKVLRTTITKILENGIKHGQINHTTDVEMLASIIFCSLEGAIMTGKLSKNNKDMKIVIRYLTHLLDEASTNYTLF